MMELTNVDENTLHVAILFGSKKLRAIRDVYR